jgi:hypothetical protein
MIDTVKLRSPAISEAVAAVLEAALVTRRAIDGPTGELLYELVSGHLVGSHDHRISLAVRRERWVVEKLPKRRDALGRYREPSVMVLTPCAPFVEVEGSIHKAMLGHNVEGGSSDVVACCRWFVGFLAAGIGVELPLADAWEVRRVDVAEVYALTYEGCEAFIRGLAAAEYPRRVALRYGETGVLLAGHSTAVKVYHKGPEFAAHDRKRLRACLTADKLTTLQWRANELLRVEVEVKARKLDADFSGCPTVGQLSAGYLTGLFDREVTKMLRESASPREVVRTSEAALERLYAAYTPAQASALYGTWLKFAAHGEKQARKRMKLRTFYDHRKKLQSAGVSWHGSDVAILPAGPIPAGFSPIRSDPRRVVAVDPRVLVLLAPYREDTALVS